jgi:pimeloyl-ACP methyl ester carboxylesterase
LEKTFLNSFMTYATSSFPAFLRSLNLENTPVTTKAGRMIAGPPAPVFELALQLGLGQFILDTPRNQQMLSNLGVGPELARVVGKRLRSRSEWRRVWGSLAEPHLQAIDGAVARGEKEVASHEINAALVLINMAYGGDGYYIHTPIHDKRQMIQTTERLYGLLRELNGERVERVVIEHPQGSTTGLLHFPSQSAKRYPGIVALHPAGGDKDSFDYTLKHFRAAGFATLCLDLPGHGENFDGPRLRPDAEVVGVAALEVLAARPEIDAERLVVMGGSLGAFFAQRTAATSPLAKACLAYASPFDIGLGFPLAVWGIQDVFTHLIGAPDYEAACQMTQPFHLRDTIAKIRCPLALVHGTQDHICDFMVPFEIAKRAQCVLSIFPVIGADHEVSQPGTEKLAEPGVSWLKDVLG